MWNHMTGGMGIGMGLWMAIWGLVGVLLVALMVVALLRLLPPSAPTFRGSMPEAPHRARQLLDERYARGEIDEAEYLARRRRLEEDRP